MREAARAAWASEGSKRQGRAAVLRKSGADEEEFRQRGLVAFMSKQKT